MGKDEKKINVIYAEDYEPLTFNASGNGVGKENLKAALHALIETVEKVPRNNSFNFKIEVKENLQ